MDCKSPLITELRRSPAGFHHKATSTAGAERYDVLPGREVVGQKQFNILVGPPVKPRTHRGKTVLSLISTEDQPPFTDGRTESGPDKTNHRSDGGSSSGLNVINDDRLPVNTTGQILGGGEKYGVAFTLRGDDTQQPAARRLTDRKNDEGVVPSANEVRPDGPTVDLEAP